MVNSIFTSTYKRMVFTVFGFSIILCMSIIFLVSPTILGQEIGSSIDSILVILAAFSFLILGSLPILSMKTLHIEPHRIVFRKYLFSYSVKEVHISHYDFYNVVFQESENGIFESVWLIKDGKLADSFSTFQYANFKELKLALNLKNKGALDISPIKQLLCHLGSKI